MGFEQLAPLKDQLAEQAKADEAEKQKKKKDTPAKKNPAPVDPVVHIIGQLQKQFPKAFPKNPAPKLTMQRE